jgi:hypothetical protein
VALQALHRVLKARTWKNARGSGHGCGKPIADLWITASRVSYPSAVREWRQLEAIDSHLKPVF